MASTDPTERARLVQQHYYVSKGLGFVLHPTIEQELSAGKADVKIANVSEEVQFPDTDGEEVPSKLTYGPPTHFSFNDIVAEEGTLREHQGQFDIVAVRLLQTSIPHDRWDVAMRNLASLVRPGGWLQWTDWDPLTPRIAAINPAASDVALRDAFMRYVDCLKAKKVGTTYRIPTSMKTCGFEDDDSDMYPLVPEVAFTSNIATGVIDFLQQSEALSESEARDMRAKVNEEIEVGKPLLWYDLWCHIAKKPI